MKPLNQAELPLTLVQDLGMEYSTSKSTTRKRFAIFICPSCGKEFRTAVPRVKNKTTTQCESCGNTKHSLSNTKAYKQWESMIYRCNNPKSKQYPRYGGRGITVYEEWQNDILSYYEYIKTLPNYGKEGWSLDRINNNGNYEPGNIRWASNTTQSNNSTLGVHGKSKYKGVTWNKRSELWMVRLMVDGERILIGYYEDELDAARAYDNYIISIKLKDKIKNKDLYNEL